jgi:hypothetical protein
VRLDLTKHNRNRTAPPMLAKKLGGCRKAVGGCHVSRWREPEESAAVRKDVAGKQEDLSLLGGRYVQTCETWQAVGPPRLHIEH